MVVTVPDTPMMVWVLPARTVLERLVDMRVDIRDRLGDLPLGRRVVFQMTLRHTDRPDIHGERGLHLRARMGDAVASHAPVRWNLPPKSTTR